MALPPVLYHIFRTPLPYVPTLALQNTIHAWQLALRKSSSTSTSASSSTSVPTHPDILLLLQHRPVYTAGRREITGKELEAARLQRLGADWVKSDRGGQTTYHGPGQLVGYPLWNIGRMGLSARCYVDHLESALRQYLVNTHHIDTLDPSPSPGLFLSPSQKIASLGISIRHRLTSHGFSLNITPEPVAWFAEVVACGLPGVRAGCVVDELAKRGMLLGDEYGMPMDEVSTGVAKAVGERFGRGMKRLTLEHMGGLEGGEEVWRSIERLEDDAKRMDEWDRAPRVGTWLPPA